MSPEQFAKEVLARMRREATEPHREAAIASLVRTAIQRVVADEREQVQGAQNEAAQCRRNYLHEKAEREKAHARIAALEVALSRQQDEIQQTLGAALGYPRYADDQKNFPGAVPADGVCVGDHVAESISKEAADRIAALERENEALRKALEEFLGAQCSEGGCCCQHGEPTEALAAALSKPRDGK